MFICVSCLPGGGGVVTKTCPILCNPMDCNQPGSSVCEISQARILEWVAISSSRRPSWLRDQTRVSCTGTRILYLWATRDSLNVSLALINFPVNKASSLNATSCHAAVSPLLNSLLQFPFLSEVNDTGCTGMT